MPSETAHLLGVQQTCVTVLPGSPNNDDGGPNVVTRVTQVRRVIGINPIQSARQDEHIGCCTLLWKVVAALLAVAVALGVPIFMVVVGSLHVNDCPVEKYIPIYLVVGGSVALALPLIRVYCTCCGDGDDEAGQPCFLFIFVVLTLFLTGWAIAGAVWTYRISKEVNTEDPDSPLYCHRLVYWSAYGLIAAYLAIMGFVCCCLNSCKKDSD